MTQNLRGLLAFAHVVEAKSFSAAAARLGITKSAVSKLVAGLEAEFGVQLLVRTTRKLALTDVGERVFAASARLARDVEAAEQAAMTHQSAVGGHLRVAAPAVLGREYFVPLAVEFQERHPQVTLELDVGDRFVDVVAGRFDVAFRVTRRFSDSSLVARRVARIRMVVCASPDYLERRGTPRGPADLAKHDVLIHGAIGDVRKWTFRRAGKTVSVKVTGRFASHDGSVTVAAAAAGAGIVLAPEFETGADLRRGRLVPVLGGWEFEGFTLNAVYAQHRHLPPKIRALVDFVAERWRTAPWTL